MADIQDKVGDILNDTIPFNPLLFLSIENLRQMIRCWNG